MIKQLTDIFDNKDVVEKIKKGLPHLFQIAEIESSRAGKIGMEVGSLRERIIVSLLIYLFGNENIETEVPVTESEIDVKVFNIPISIKTITGTLSGVKLIWTVDTQKAAEFRENYYPTCDILLVQINWNNIGALYYIPLEAQETLFNKIGRENYIKLPKPGTNPRGVEITKEALTELTEGDLTQKIEIHWIKEDLDHDPYKRWVDYWLEE